MVREDKNGVFVRNQASSNRAASYYQNEVRNVGARNKIEESATTVVLITMTAYYVKNTTALDN
jgi:hypothetical protein